MQVENFYQSDDALACCALINTKFGSDCQIMEQYAESCKDAGVQICTWREASGYEMKCPPNSTPQQCVNACPNSCRNLNAEDRYWLDEICEILANYAHSVCEFGNSLGNEAVNLVCTVAPRFFDCFCFHYEHS